MPRRFALPITLVLFALLLAVGVVWRTDPRPDAVEPLVLDYVSPRGYVCYRAAGPVTIDGKLDDPAWKDIPWSDDFVDIEGDAKPKPRYRTRVKMMWDDENLYIGAELQEPHLQASFTRHDSFIFYQDHDFEVFLDPDGDNHLYAELEMNALNTTWDLLLAKPYRDGGPAIHAWEIAGLKTAVHLDGTLNDPSDTDRGWTVEIAWPFRGLKEIAPSAVPPVAGRQWRINFSRVELEFEVAAGKYRKVPDREQNWVWSPQGVVNMHMPERWGYVQFSMAKPGVDSFRPDPAAPARAVLMRIYEAQQQYRKDHGTYAATLAELGLRGLTHPSLDGTPRLETMSDSFDASVPHGGTRWHVRNDSRVWKDE
ncbi:MAG: carbohydrate-binding family 9-like protein [Gemmataceae bacterium]